MAELESGPYQAPSIPAYTSPAVGETQQNAANDWGNVQSLQQQAATLNQQAGYEKYTVDVMGNITANPPPKPPVDPNGGASGSGSITAYEQGVLANEKAKLAEQQREFDAKQAQDQAQFLQTQHTEEEKLQFAREQETNKVQFQYAQLAQSQQQFEQTLGWDKTKFYTQMGLDITKEQDQAVQAYRDELAKVQGSPKDVVSYLWNLRGYQAPAGGQPSALPLSPSVIAAMQAQGIPLPQAQQQGAQNNPNAFMGTLPQGFGGGLPQPNMQAGQSPQMAPPTPPMPGNQQNPMSSVQNMMGAIGQMGQQLGQQAMQPLGVKAPPMGINPAASHVAQPNVMSGGQVPPTQGGAAQSGSQTPFNVWDYLPPQIKSFFNGVPGSQQATPGNQSSGQSNAVFPGTQVQPIIPSAQMYNQLLPSEQQALGSVWGQQLGVLPDDMLAQMNQNAPVNGTPLQGTQFK